MSTIAYKSGSRETAALADTARDTADEEQFSLLVHRQHRFVYKVAYTSLRNIPDAEDVTQETFLKLLRNGSWKTLRDERAFLAQAAWRLALDRHRAPKLDRSDVQADQKPSLHASPEQNVLDADTSATIHRLIEALPEEFRHPLLLSAIDEMTSSEIAAILGLPAGTVRSRIAHARKLLKNKLAHIQEVHKGVHDAR
jgi:RNA polymerase sigma-70 factor (ECF subfamily)